MLIESPLVAFCLPISDAAIIISCQAGQRLRQHTWQSFKGSLCTCCIASFSLYTTHSLMAFHNRHSFFSIPFFTFLLLLFHIAHAGFQPVLQETKPIDFVENVLEPSENYCNVSAFTLSNLRCIGCHPPLTIKL